MINKKKFWVSFTIFSVIITMLLSVIVFSVRVAAINIAIEGDKIQWYDRNKYKSIEEITNDVRKEYYKILGTKLDILQKEFIIYLDERGNKVKNKLETDMAMVSMIEKLNKNDLVRSCGTINSETYDMIDFYSSSDDNSSVIYNENNRNDSLQNKKDYYNKEVLMALVSDNKYSYVDLRDSSHSEDAIILKDIRDKEYNFMEVNAMALNSLVEEEIRNKYGKNNLTVVSILDSNLFIEKQEGIVQNKDVLVLPNSNIGIISLNDARIINERSVSKFAINIFEILVVLAISMGMAFKFAIWDFIPNSTRARYGAQELDRLTISLITVFIVSPLIGLTLASGRGPISSIITIVILVFWLLLSITTDELKLLTKREISSTEW